MLIHKDFPPYLTVAWSIVFTEKNSLPSTEYQHAVFNDDADGAARQGGHHVGWGVSFKVFVRILLGYDPTKDADQVALNGRIGPFVNGNTCRGMWIVRNQ